MNGNEIQFFLHTLVIILSIFVVFKAAKHEGLTILSLLFFFLANFFVLKQIRLFGIPTTAVDPYTIGSFLTLGLIQEFFGEERAKRTTIMFGLFAAFIAIFSSIHIRYLPAPGDFSHFHYSILLWESPRIFLASILSLFLSQRLQIYAFQRLRFHFPLMKASLIALIFSQAFDTVFFTFAALWKTLPHLLSMMTFSFLIKLLSIALMTPFTKLFERMRNNGSFF